MIDPRLLEILACPACEDHPRVREEDGFLVCDACRRAYPIRDGVPVMIVGEAEVRE